MITTNKDKLKTFLEQNTWARERKNKNIAVAALLYDEPDKLIRIKDKQSRVRAFADLIREANNLDRCWRKILEEYPEIRGKDYDDKVVLEQQAKIDLGYEPSYPQPLF